MLLWSLLILLLLFLAACLGILVFQAREVLARQAVFEETLWKRRHRVPLLIEGMHGHWSSANETELIDIRARLQSGAYLLEEQVELEKKLTEVLGKIFQAAEVSPAIRADSLVLSLRKEFADLLEGVRTAQNDYLYALQKWHRWLRFPFFRIFEFCFEIRKNQPLTPL